MRLCMKQSIAIFIFIVFVLPLSFAATFNSGIFEYEDSFVGDGSVWLTSCKPLDGQTVLNIPDEIDSKPVSGISSGLGIWKGGFLESDSIEEITIPASITHIDSDAFADATALESFIVSSDNQKYASIQGILYDKENKSILCYPQAREDLSFAVFDGILEIDSYAFYGTANLQNVILPDSIEAIGASAFGNSGIISINFPEGIEKISYSAFFNCNSLIDVILPSSLASLGPQVFVCRLLESISVSADNPNFCSVDGVLFTKDMSELIAYPASKSIGGEYVIPENVKSINDTAFCYAKLDNIVLPLNLEEIGYSAFWGSWIENITIPASVSYIGEDIFGNCTWLDTVNVTEGSYAFIFGLENDWGKYITYFPSWLGE